MQYNNDYERLAYYEAKMNYYGSKLNEFDGGSRQEMALLSEAIKVEKENKANYEKNNDVINKRKEVEILENENKAAATAAGKAATAKTAATNAAATAKTAAENATAALTKANALVVSTTATATTTAENAKNTLQKLTEYKLTSEIDKHNTECNNRTKKISELENKLLVETASTNATEAKEAIKSGFNKMIGRKA